MAADWVGIVQAGASVVAIGAGFYYVRLQRRTEVDETGRAAVDLARHALDFITERLDALVDPARPIEYALRGSRTAEMIQVLREIPVSSLPPSAVEKVAIIRSAVFAVNARIDDVLIDDADRKHERRKRLHSSGRAVATARGAYEELAADKAFSGQCIPGLKPVSPRMGKFIEESERTPKSGRLEPGLT